MGLVYFLGCVGIIYFVALIVAISPILVVGWMLEQHEKDRMHRALGRGEWP